MRMICPNCGAQYEVDDKVIPDDGRDVQCSNCGHTWFQRPGHLDQGLADELNQETGDTGIVADADASEGSDAAQDKPLRERRGLDPQVADVLREEAAREAAVRRGEGAPLETQPDLGLDDADDGSADRSAAARARMARLRGTDDASPEAAAALAAASASRRDLLPDIEEINSSLRASQDRDEDAADTDDGAVAQTTRDTAPRKGGYRAGRTLTLLLAVIAIAVYVLAPQIIRALPQSEPYLIAYVDAANTLRARADAGLDLVIAKVRDLVASVTGG